MTPERPAASRTHLVLIPSYNPGSLVRDTVRAARAQWNPVWVISDGSTDHSLPILRDLAASDSAVRLIELPHNQGKGAALLAGLQAAAEQGFTHALTLDADGQHPTALIPAFMQASIAAPGHMILGRPVYDAQAPRIRVHGHKISNFWGNLASLHGGLGDVLYGFRVYPIAELLAVMRSTRWMRRFDFDPEAAVRLSWHGVRPVNIDAPVRYLSATEGGVSHFKYLRDNLLLSAMYLRLLAGCLWRRALGAARAR